MEYNVFEVKAWHASAYIKFSHVHLEHGCIVVDGFDLLKKWYKIGIVQGQVIEEAKLIVVILHDKCLKGIFSHSLQSLEVIIAVDSCSNNCSEVGHVIDWRIP